ncbi:MAG TPA: RDD family protein [Methanoregulaceae archaeon]|nr:MAG: RDD family protein [Methanolinea sp.]HON81449.1 RDD family protein [Methanoregulaceae archaeon]HPD10023.1 RDD family protein [Methanoregulaceae archaeon]HRT15029.1 RDD family protein [Methanoregulaceae archaeon]HRU30600.1 RDD family protein [Methanoregulaceae archaeon]
MYCPKCGKVTEQSGKYCQWCGANLTMYRDRPFTRKRVGSIRTEKFAGLGGRFLGGLIDLIFLVLFDLMAAAFVGIVSWLFRYPDPISETIRMLYQYYLHVPRTDATGQIVNAAIPPQILLSAGIFLLLIPWIYFAYLESSRNQASLGKLVIRVAVTDMQGNRITFSRATLRFFGKWLCVLTLFIGFLIIAFTAYRQGLHDKIAGTMVFCQ